MANALVARRPTAEWYDAYRLEVTGTGSAAGNLTSPFISAPASGAWSLTIEETVESVGMKTLASVAPIKHTMSVEDNYRRAERTLQH